MGESATQQDASVECIAWEGQMIAHIVRADRIATQTEFITEASDKQQVGFIVYPAGGRIARHVHRPVERRVVGMSEVLLVRQGRLAVDFYTQDERYVAGRTLEPGDLVVLVAGGHGFTCLEDTVLLEIKQGPYVGPDEKKCF